MTTGRLAAVATCVTLLAVAAASCGGQDRDESYRVGYAYGVDVGDTGDLVAYDRAGHDGIRVRVTNTGGPQAAVAALTRGDLDLAVLNLGNASSAISLGAPVVAVLPQNMKLDLSLVTRGLGLRDLRGRSVATFSNSDLTSGLVDLVAARAGLPAGAIRVRPLGDSKARATALAEGRIDASVLETTDILGIRNRVPDLRVLGTMSSFGNADALIVFVTTRDHVDAVRPLIRKLLGTYEDLSAGRATREFVQAAESHGVGSGEAGARELLARYRAIQLWPTRGALVSRAQYDRAVAFLTTIGQIEQPLPFARVWDLSAWRDSR